MDIPVNAPVECLDGPCGRCTQVIVNPTTRCVTHLVVRENGLFGEERLVPIDRVMSTTPAQIRLRCARADIEVFRQFVDYEFVAGTMPLYSYQPDQYVWWPQVVHRNVPQGAICVRRGLRVKAADGWVGRVDEFVVDDRSGYITHLVLREGHWWGQKEVTVPVSDIERVGEEGIYLKLSRRVVEALPAVAMH